MDKEYNVLFLCTGNSARSILAEAILNRTGGRNFRAFSAGSAPKGKVNPVALKLLTDLNHPTSQLRSKSWNEFSGASAIPLHFIFTLCDNAAEEVCPVWPGQPVTAHWGLPDPAGVTGAGAVKYAAFADTYRVLQSGIEKFTDLPVKSLTGRNLRQSLDEIRTAMLAKTHEVGLG